MKPDYKNRIALYYMMATAIMVAIVFSVIYIVVHETVVKHLDSDLSFEARKHSGEIRISGDSIRFTNKEEWAEREHKEIQVNPVFIQLMDKQGRVMDKSPNLKDDLLPFKDTETGGHFDARLNNRAVRLIQLPIQKNNEIKGYILAAISSESSEAVIRELRNVLLFSYLVLLAVLYVVSRFLAGRSIKPVQEISHTISRITQHRNLGERVELPQHRDEIYDLSANFNDLLDRIESAIEREKQFTSDASHEMRTPLAVLRGTLEVLIRKPRKQQEYEEKIRYSLSEIDHITGTLDQLFLLARLDLKTEKQDESLVPISTLINESLSMFSDQIEDKHLNINLSNADEEQALVPHYYSDLIINNILSNAIKYSKENTTIHISVYPSDGRVVCIVKDEGIGIKKEDLSHIYENFFRSDAMEHNQIKGNGLGLSIVRKSADAIGAQLEITSEYGQGTTVTIKF